jgi:hypothetical protein
MKTQGSMTTGAAALFAIWENPHYIDIEPKGCTKV